MSARGQFSILGDSHKGNSTVTELENATVVSPTKKSLTGGQYGQLLGAPGTTAQGTAATAAGNAAAGKKPLAPISPGPAITGGDSMAVPQWVWLAGGALVLYFLVNQ
jgi:hypothetical protein